MDTSLTDSQKILLAAVEARIAQTEQNIINRLDRRDGWLRKLVRDTATYIAGILK